MNRTLFIALMLCAATISCGDRVRPNISIAPILSDRGNLVLAFELLSRTNVINQNGHKVAGINVFGVHRVDSIHALRGTNTQLIIFRDPAISGLLESRYAEKLAEKSTTLTAPIRLTRPETAVIVTAASDGTIQRKRRERFGFISITLHPSVLEQHLNRSVNTNGVQ